MPCQQSKKLPLTIAIDLNFFYIHQGTMLRYKPTTQYKSKFDNLTTLQFYKGFEKKRTYCWFGL